MCCLVQKKKPSYKSVYHPLRCNFSENLKAKLATSVHLHGFAGRSLFPTTYSEVKILTA